MTVSGDYAYVASGVGLRVIDISNPSSAVEVGFCDTPGHARGVIVVGDFAFVAAAHCGLRVIYIANPTTPFEVGFYDTPGLARGIAVIGSIAYVANGCCFGVYDWSEVIGMPSPHTSVLPQTFVLHPCYPNPFNSTTQISFDLPRSAFVQLRVYNVQGQVVDNLVSRVFPAGTHNFIYNPNHCASGTYMVCMTTGDYLSAQKFTLLK